MWRYIFLIIFLFVAWRIYHSVLVPYRLYLKYRQILKNSQYKFLDRGFLPYVSIIFLKYIQNIKKYNDSHFETKVQYPKYDVALSNISNKVVIEVMNTDLVKEFYSHEGTQTYTKYRQFILNFKRLIGTSVVFDEGEIWKRKRKLMTELLNFNYLKRKQIKMIEVVENKLNQIKKTKDISKVNLIQLLSTISSTIVIQIFFGGSSNHNFEIQGTDLSVYLCQIFEDVGNQAIDPVILLTGQKFLKMGLRANDRRVTAKINKYTERCQNFVRSRIYELEEQKKKGIVKDEKDEDYIERRFKKFDAKPTEQFIEELVSDFMVMYFAGTDSTAMTTMMALCYSAMHPEVLYKLKKQIDEYITSDEDINQDVLKKMKYLEAVFFETIRYYQPFNQILPREVMQDHYLGSLPIAKGMLIMTGTFGIQYDEKHFEDPFRFKPQRWINEKQEIKYPKPYTSLTFSAGPRSCIGRQLAEMQLKIMLIKILQQFDLNVEDKTLVMSLDKLLYQPQKNVLTLQKKQI